jgi:hypothetical protein
MMVPLTASQRDLAESYFWLAMNISRSVGFRQHSDRDDIESAAALGLVGAASRSGDCAFDSFEDYAARAIRNAITKHFQDKSAACRVPPGGKTFPLVDGEVLSRELSPEQEFEFWESFEPMRCRVECDSDGVDPDEPVLPCVDCGNEKGYVSKGRYKPDRLNGMCRRCYNRLASRLYRAKKKGVT